MSGPETQRPPPIDKDLLERFKQDVRERRGKLRGNYGTELERAIESYLEASKGGDVTHRLGEIEDGLDEIKTLLTDDEDKKKKESGGGSSTTEKRLRKIKSTVTAETSGSNTVHQNVVEMAIREHAGSSDPTVRRYMTLLEQDDSLFKHPRNESLFFRDPEVFAQTVNTMAKSNGLSGEEYESIVEQHGEEWWKEQLEGDEDGKRGFQ